MRLPNGYGGVTKLSGRRRKPYMVRKTIGWHIDEKTDKKVQDYVVIGYAATKSEALQMLADYNKNPFDVSASKITFKEVYERFTTEKFPTISKSNINGYNASYKVCEPLYNRVFKEIKLAELQNIVDTCGKSYPSLRKLKVLMDQLYKYAMKNEICNKNYADFVNIAKFKDRNPNKRDREKFTKEEIDRLWQVSDDKYYQIVLMLIYSGVRISELLNLRREDVNLNERYFDVTVSKTENGNMFDYHNYLDSYFKPLMTNLNMTHTPHCTRHTCISMLAEAQVDQTTIKKIVGHSGAMTMTERVYTHLDVEVLINAINKI